MKTKSKRQKIVDGAWESDTPGDLTVHTRHRGECDAIWALFVTQHGDECARLDLLRHIATRRDGRSLAFAYPGRIYPEPAIVEPTPEELEFLASGDPCSGGGP